MRDIYSETISLCPVCGKDTSAFYEERGNEMFLFSECNEHGLIEKKVENESRFFVKQYELDYERGVSHLVLPVTYRCNLRCSYCYTLSNSFGSLPVDRPTERIIEIIRAYHGNIMLAGGEPTMRDDLPSLVCAAQAMSRKRKISIASNGQKLSDKGLVKTLKDSGLDFVFLSLHDRAFDSTETIYRRRRMAMENCHKIGMPVWISRTVDNLKQLDSLAELIETYRKTIFKVTIRAAASYGTAYPLCQIFVSDILKYLGKEHEYEKGRSPFNVHIRLQGKDVKVCSWVDDMKRLDPIDDDYLISNDAVVPFHRGMKLDEMLLFKRIFMTNG